eukprot:SAG31_NODE_1500_length_8090_cov_10.522588_11_plen_59_part_00
MIGLCRRSMGYSDLGVFGSRNHSTPHIDRLVKGGESARLHARARFGAFAGLLPARYEA